MKKILMTAILSTCVSNETETTTTVTSDLCTLQDQEAGLCSSPWDMSWARAQQLQEDQFPDVPVNAVYAGCSGSSTGSVRCFVAADETLVSRAFCIECVTTALGQTVCAMYLDQTCR